METILLAAGESRRMREDKALLNIGDKKVICHILDKLLKFSKKVFIILSDNYDNVKEFLIENHYPMDRIFLVFNENSRMGMFSSVIKGFQSTSGKELILLQMIDQPFITLSLYKQLIVSIDDENLIFQPAKLIKGKPRFGHPILFSNKFREILINHKEEANLKDLINLYQDKRKIVETEENCIFDNLNTVEDLNKKKEEKGFGNNNL